AGNYTEHGRDPDQHALRHVNVAEQAIHERPERRDQDDCRQGGAGGLALLVAQPEDQERHDHRSPANPEKTAERARNRADHGQPSDPRGHAGHTTARAVAGAEHPPQAGERVGRGTITLPPPIPTRPLSTPATVPITASRATLVDMRGILRRVPAPTAEVLAETLSPLTDVPGEAAVF